MKPKTKIIICFAISLLICIGCFLGAASAFAGDFNLENGNSFDVKKDFSWGVLAINTDKSIYLPNETAKLQFGVLSDWGNMVCDAKLKLIIKNEKLKIEEELTTENGKIKVNQDVCNSHDLTLKPDYEAEYQLGEEGTYELTLTAETANGVRTIYDKVEVKKDTPFDVERAGPTRIYPLNEYPIIFNITANEDFKGEIIETVPDSFKITNPKSEIQNPEGEQVPYGAGKFQISNSKDKKEKQIIWNVDVKKGDKLNLEYEFDAPDISPEFYLLGPLKFKSQIPSNKFQISSNEPNSNIQNAGVIFQEARQWQIASDASPTEYTSGSGQFQAEYTGLHTITLIGGGGGGAGGASGNKNGGGGGGGGAACVVEVSLTQGQNYNYSVGTAGPGGLTTADGTAGGNTTFVVGGTTYTAGGGGGGRAPATYTGGSGGTASNCDTNNTGGTGGNGTAADGSGGGGGAAGTTGVGKNGTLVTAGGATTLYGGAGGAGTNGNSSPGTTATDPYGGGGGGGTKNAGGGNGNSGYVRIEWVPLITVSGGCFTDDTEGTQCTNDVNGSSDNISVSINGAAPVVIDTAVDGSWTGSIAQPANGAVMTFFRDASSGSIPEANKATTITKYSGSGNVTLVKMYENQVVIGADTGSTTLTDTDIDTSGNGYENSDDTDVLYAVDGSTFSTNVNSSTHHLYIIGSNTFQPASGGGVTATTTNLYIEGTLASDSNAFYVVGNYTNTGTLSTSGTVYFSAPSGTQYLNSGGTGASKSFFYLQHTGAGTLQLLTNGIAITDFTNSAGTFDANGQTATVGGLTTISGGEYQAKTATQTFNNNVTLSGGNFTGSSGNVDINGALTITSGTFTAPSGTFTVSGNYSNAGTFTPGSNTIVFDGGSTQTLNSGGTGAGKQFNIVQHTGAGILRLLTSALQVNGTFLNNGGNFDTSTNNLAATFTGLVTVQSGAYLAGTATQTFNAGITLSGGTFTGGSGNVDVNGALTITTGTFTAPSGTFTVSGNYSNAATFTPGSNTITFDGGSTQTLNSGGTGAGKQFAGIAHIGAGTLQLITNGLSATGAFNNSNGTFDANGQTATFGGAVSITGGEYLASTATQTFNYAVTSALAVNGGNFTGSSGNVDINGSLSIVSGTFTAPSGTFTISGNYSNSATFTPGSNTVTFDGGSIQSFNPGGTGAGKQFNNIQHTGAGTLQLTNNALQVNGTFLNNGGNYDASTNNLASTFTGLYTLQAGSYLAGTATQTFNAGITLSGGTFTGGSGNVDVNGALTISSGTFTAPSGTFTVSGNYSNAGTFTPGSNTINFDGGSTQTLNSGGTGAGKTFSGFIHSGAGTLQLLTNPIKITGAFNNSNGIFDAGTNSLDQTFSGNFTNSATFTAGSTTTTFDGASQQTLSGTMTGSSSFGSLTLSNYSGADPTNPNDGSLAGYTPGIVFSNSATATGDYTITTGSVRVSYHTGDSYIFNNINWNGQDAGSMIFFRNSEEANHWLLEVTGTQTAVEYVNVAYSDAQTLGGNEIQAGSGCSSTNYNAGQNVYWIFGSGGGGSSLTVSGNSDLSSGTVYVAVNGTVQTGHEATISEGSWGTDTICGSGDDIITAWVHDAGTHDNDATAVYKYSGSGNVTDLALNTHQLTLGDGTNSQSFAVSDLENYDNDDDGNILFTSNSGTFDANAQSFSDAALVITNNTTLTVGTSEIMSANDVTITGDLTSGGDSTYNLSGDWTNNGAFTPSSSTVDFNGSGTQTLNSGGTGAGKTFENLTHSGNGTLQLSTNDLVIGGDFLQSGTGTFVSTGQVVAVLGDFELDSGSQWTKGDGLYFGYIDGTSNFYDYTTGQQDLGAVELDRLSETGFTLALQTAMKVTSLNITTDTTLDATGQTLNLTGSGSSLLTIDGTLTQTGATMKFSGTTATDIPAMTYNNLELSPAGGSNPTYTLLAGASEGGFQSCGDDITFNYKGETVTYGTVSVGSQCWMDRNLGATKIAESYNDCNTQDTDCSYGDYFQWGRLDDGHQEFDSSTVGTQASSIIPGHNKFITGYPNWLSSQVDTLWQSNADPNLNYQNNPCPAGWHVPSGGTTSEWDTAMDTLGLTGCTGTPTDCRTLAASSALKLPAAGYRSYANGLLYDQVSYGAYWSGSPNTTTAYLLYFYDTNVNPAESNSRAFGFSVRCLKN